MQHKENKNIYQWTIKAIQRAKGDGGKVEKLEMNGRGLEMHTNMERIRKGLNWYPKEQIDANLKDFDSQIDKIIIIIII